MIQTSLEVRGFIRPHQTLKLDCYILSHIEKCMSNIHDGYLADLPSEHFQYKMFKNEVEVQSFFKATGIDILDLIKYLAFEALDLKDYDTMYGYTVLDYVYLGNQFVFTYFLELFHMKLKPYLEQLPDTFILDKNGKEQVIEKFNDYIYDHRKRKTADLLPDYNKE